MINEKVERAKVVIAEIEDREKELRTLTTEISSNLVSSFKVGNKLKNVPEGDLLIVSGIYSAITTTSARNYINSSISSLNRFLKRTDLSDSSRKELERELSLLKDAVNGFDLVVELKEMTTSGEAKKRGGLVLYVPEAYLKDPMSGNKGSIKWKEYI